MKKVLFAGMILMGTFVFAACDNKTETSDAEVTTDTTTKERESAPAVADTTAITADTAATKAH
jgi:uncharacterized lipoprotein NlpE involved in copper resistance